MGKIFSVNYNWRFSQENGEEFGNATIGYNGVKDIIEHTAKGDGDKWYYDIEFESGTIMRVFNINQVVYK